jgi:TetR/AcrR family transcriptional regulator
MVRSKSRKTFKASSKTADSSSGNMNRIASVGSRQTPIRHNAQHPSRTRLRILNIAANEFARKGFDGARVDEIARRCKVNKNLIYHYFDSKDALFVAVLEQAYAKLRERQESMGLDTSDAIEGISKLVIDSFKYWGDSKHFIAYLNSENFYNAKHIKKSKFIQSSYPALIGSIRVLLRRGEEQGIFRSGVDPVDLYISISSLGYHFFSNQSTFSVILGKNFSDRKTIEKRLNHAVDVILGYLQFDSPATLTPSSKSPTTP